MGDGVNEDLRKWQYTVGISSAEELRDDVSKKSSHTYLTFNGKGYTFSLKNLSASYWLSSLPESSAPLVDLGAGFGFRAADAVQSGRNVIAVDCDQRHLDKIAETVSNVMNNANNQRANDTDRTQLGQLLDTKLATLPQTDLFQDNSVAGILASQVLHFLQPGEPLLVFRDAFRWLQPGGLFVVSTASPAIMEFLLRIHCKLERTRSVEEIWQFLQSATDEEIVNDCPCFVKVTHPAAVRVLSSSLLCFSTNELRALARLSGFEILKLDYFQPPNAAIPFSSTDMATVLIARKPKDSFMS